MKIPRTLAISTLQAKASNKNRVSVRNPYNSTGLRAYSMTKRIACSLLLFAAMIALAPITRAVDRVVTTDASTGAGSLQAAILALNDGDHITFHIPPEAGEVHYIMVPP